MFLQEKCWWILLTTLFNLIFSIIFVVSLQIVVPHFLGDIKLNSEIWGGNSIDIILLLVELHSLLKIVEDQDEYEGNKHDDSSLLANLVILLLLIWTWLLTGVLHEELRSRLIAIGVIFWWWEVVLDVFIFALKIIDIKRAVIFTYTFCVKIGEDFLLVDGVRALFVLEALSLEGICWINSAWGLILERVLVDSNSITLIGNFGDGTIFACHYNFAHDEWERCTLNGRITLVTKGELAVSWRFRAYSLTWLVTHDIWINQDGKDGEQRK